MSETIIAHVVHEDGGNAYVLTGDAALDYRDGYTLRALRKAVWGRASVEVYGPRKTDGKFLVQVVPYDLYDQSPSSEAKVIIRREGSTISDAADQCLRGVIGAHR